MPEVNGLPTGQCIPCDSNCATCAKTPAFCLSCPSGSSLVALKCISNQNIGFSLTFSSPTAASPAAEMQSFMIILEEIRATLAGLMGAPYSTNPNLISFSSILSGSVIVGGLMDTTGSDPAASLTTATNKLGASPGFGSFDMTNSNFVANGFNP